MHPAGRWTAVITESSHFHGPNCRLQTTFGMIRDSRIPAGFDLSQVCLMILVLCLQRSLNQSLSGLPAHVVDGYPQMTL